MKYKNKKIYNILVSWKVSSNFKNILRKELPRNCKVIYPKKLDEEYLVSLLNKKKIDILIAGICTKEMIEKSKYLKLIHSMIKSVGRIDLEAARKKRIIVTNTSGYCGRSVAEFILAAMIIMSRNLHLFLNKKEWKRETWSLNFDAFEIKNRKVCILGIGEIGLELAKLCKKLGMEVYGVEKDIEKIKKLKRKKIFKFITTPEKRNIRKVLKISDFVCICLPKTEETLNFISEKEMKTMKRNAIIIDTSRGGILNFDDLYKILKIGKIRGAFCDVFPQEPPDYSHPIFNLKNFCFTPHIAGVTYEAEILQVRKTVETIKNFILKKPLKNRIV